MRGEVEEINSKITRGALFLFLVAQQLYFRVNTGMIRGLLETPFIPPGVLFISYHKVIGSLNVPHKWESPPSMMDTDQPTRWYSPLCRLVG